MVKVLDAVSYFHVTFSPQEPLTTDASSALTLPKADPASKAVPPLTTEPSPTATSSCNIAAVLAIAGSDIRTTNKTDKNFFIVCSYFYCKGNEIPPFRKVNSVFLLSVA